MNQQIINNFEILAKYYKKTGDKWRQQAYQRAIFAIRMLSFQITNINQVKNIKGIGKTTKEKIKEYLDTGKIRKVEEVKQKMQELQPGSQKYNILETFIKIWGVGEKKAEDLWKKGMRSLDDLRNNPKLLTKNQKIGLKYYEDFQLALPRYYIYIFHIAIKVILSIEFPHKSFRLEIAGSYRRGKEESNDIDCLLTSKDFTLNQAVKALKKWDMITDVLSMKNAKFMGVAHCRGGIGHNFRLDIEYLPEEEWGSGLLYFTGSKGFNIMIRGEAKKRGYTLNQHGLFDKGGKRIPVYTEQDILEKIGVKYIEPNRR